MSKMPFGREACYSNGMGFLVNPAATVREMRSADGPSTINLKEEQVILYSMLELSEWTRTFGGGSGELVSVSTT
jgi:hypothetical protein